MRNYTILHLHTMISNSFTTLDSITSYKDYVDRASELGMKALAFTEHGNVMKWLHKKEYIESKGMKYIHASEVYVTNSLETKIRDNFHCILIAKNYEGFKELNYLLSDKVACNRRDNHFYFQPRISYDELKNTSGNIIISTACLGGILGTVIKEEKPKNNLLRNDFIEFLAKNKHRCYLEIQHHNTQEQISYNRYLYHLNLQHKIPLLATTDTHCLNNEHVEGRKVLQKAKSIYFENEESWDLTFKTYEELLQCFKKQNLFNDKQIEEALENTNRIADMVEEFKIDRSHKYPRLFKNPEKRIKEKIYEGVKDRNLELNNKLKDRVNHEYKVMKKTDTINYMLLEEDVKLWCRENDILYGYSRGSVSGSMIAYLLKVTEIDSIKFNLSFERFMNPERVSLADIDTDYPPSQRDRVKEYIYNKHGLYCADIVTFNTIAIKGAIRDVGRAFEMSLDEINQICKDIELEEDILREKYPELFKYVDLLNGVIVSIGSHPCGLVVSPHPLEDTVGTFMLSTNEYPITQLNMKEIDSMNYVKLDLLGLDNIEIINETCKLAGIKRLTPDNIYAEDEEVWKSIHNSGLGIFQWSSTTAHDYYKHLFSKETVDHIRLYNPNFKYIDLFSVGNGAIRPAGESYRNELAQGNFKDNGHPALNELLSDTQGFLVYQEQILEFLNKFCGFTMAEADLVRRGFAKKTGTEQYLSRIKKGFIETMVQKYNTTEKDAEKIVVDFIKVIEDASSYLFSVNHSLPYSYIGYACAWLRYYYPLEFLTVMLNINDGKMDKTTQITSYMNEFTDINLIPPKFRYSLANYNLNKEENSIYKGMNSIKFLNNQVADELYQLKNNKYNTFIDLLADINSTSCNSRQLEILIKLNFFEEFGTDKKLYTIYKYFQKLYDKKQLKKEKAKELNISEETMSKFSRATEKTYMDFDSLGLLYHIESRCKDLEFSIKEKLQAELEYLGYLDSTWEEYEDTIFITEVNTKYTPRLTTYNIQTGEYETYKVYKNIFYENPIMEHDICEIIKFEERNRRKKVNDEWIELEEKEKILKSYYVY